jgi:hypothetical protein
MEGGESNLSLKVYCFGDQNHETGWLLVLSKYAFSTPRRKAIFLDLILTLHLSHTLHIFS